jgi:hypothetical protein
VGLKLEEIKNLSWACNVLCCCDIFTIHAALTLFFREQEHTAVICTCYNCIINRTFYRSCQGNVTWLWRNGARDHAGRPCHVTNCGAARYDSVRPWTNLPQKKHFHVKKKSSSSWSLTGIIQKSITSIVCSVVSHYYGVLYLKKLFLLRYLCSKT